MLVRTHFGARPVTPRTGGVGRQNDQLDSGVSHHSLPVPDLSQLVSSSPRGDLCTQGQHIPCPHSVGLLPLARAARIDYTRSALSNIQVELALQQLLSPPLLSYF